MEVVDSIARPKRESLKRWLRRACDDMRKHIAARRVRSEAEIAREIPSARAPIIEWVRAYGTLRALVWHEATGPGRSAQAEDAMLAALRDEPQEVTLLSGDIVRVYPKGLDSLLWFRHHDWFVEWMAPRVATLRDAVANHATEGLATPITTLEHAQTELAYQIGAFCAEATNPGPAKGEWATDNADLPELWKDVNPHDVVQVHRAFMECNATRLQALDHIVRPQKADNSDRPMSWNVFVASMAMRLNIDPKTLARDRPLVSLLATVRLAREAEPELELD